AHIKNTFTFVQCYSVPEINLVIKNIFVEVSQFGLALIGNLHPVRKHTTPDLEGVNTGNGIERVDGQHTVFWRERNIAHAKALSAAAFLRFFFASLREELDSVIESDDSQLARVEPAFGVGQPNLIRGRHHFRHSHV